MSDDSSRPWPAIWKIKHQNEDEWQKVIASLDAILSSCKRTKDDLEKLLGVSILELEYLPKEPNAKPKAIFCTGNIRFININKKLNPKDKQAQLKSPFVGLKSSKPDIVAVYDLMDKKIKSIKLNSWHVVYPYIMVLSQDNVIYLDSIVNTF